MNNIKLNGHKINYNKIIYISNYGNDTDNDGSIYKPYKTFEKAINQAEPYDLIYFKKDKYKIFKLTEIQSYSGSFLFDKKNVPVTIYAEPYTKIIINNPINETRDSHAICLSEEESKVIGFTIEYNITNKSGNYSTAIFAGRTGYQQGNIYNCHFKIMSQTSFSYSNGGNTQTCHNCQFDIFSPILSSYSGTEKFENCYFSNEENLKEEYNNITSNKTNTINICFDNYYDKSTKKSVLMEGMFNWKNKINIKFLFKDENNNYYSIRSNLLSNNIFKEIKNDESLKSLFDKFGFYNIEELLYKNNIINYNLLLKNKDDFSYCELKLDSNFKNINNIE